MDTKYLCVVLICDFMLCVVLIVFLCFYVLCLLYAPSHQKKFQVGVNLLGNKSHSDSDSDSDSEWTPVFLLQHLVGKQGFWIFGGNLKSYSNNFKCIQCRLLWRH